MALPANVRPSWKDLPGTNGLTYLASLSVAKKKSFITLTPGQRKPVDAGVGVGAGVGVDGWSLPEVLTD